MKFPFFILLWLAYTSVSAQELPIGGWKEYLSYGNAMAVTSSDNKVYCATTLGLYSISRTDGSTERYSKITGLSDIGYSTIAFDKKHQLLFIAYANSNIDIMTAHEIINIPDIKLKNIIGDRNIYDVFFDGDYAYLSCGFGIVVINLLKNEISDTYIIGANGNSIRVNQLCADANNFYAATTSGILKASKQSSNLAYYANWTNISGTEGLPSGEAKKILLNDGKIYCSVKDTLFERNGSVWHKIFYQNNWTINSINKGRDGIILCQNNAGMTDAKLTLISKTGEVDSVRHNYFIRNPLSVHQDDNGTFWIADFFTGLIFRDSQNIFSLVPNGPGTPKVSDMAIYNHTVYVAPGSVSDWMYLYNRDGFFVRKDDSWFTFNQYADPKMDSILDIFVVTANPKNGNAFFGSYGGGLVEYNPDGVFNLYKQNSSLQSPQGDPNSYRVSGIAFDKDGNAWVSNFTAPKPISVKTADGKWYSFQPTVENAGGMLAQVVVDNNNYKWFVLARGNGILVYDSGNDISSPADDRYKKLGMGINKGGLPNLFVNCLAADKDGQIWVGTDQGIAVYYCPSEIFMPSGCDAQQVLVKEDQYYNYLLVNEVIHDIEVDGANRKWISTDNGVFLMSADGMQQIYHFTETNSPLFSNYTTAIALDDKTGEVFIGTEKGIQVFRSEAMNEDIATCNPFVYPNPVREDYNGVIAIKGLVSNSEVKITDIAGNLVYQTKALGTQAIWNGKTLTGERAATGVYLVFAVSPDGTQSCKTKMVFIN